MKESALFKIVAVLYPIVIMLDTFVLPSTELGGLLFSEELDARRIKFPFFFCSFG